MLLVIYETVSCGRTCGTTCNGSFSISSFKSSYSVNHDHLESDHEALYVLGGGYHSLIDSEYLQWVQVAGVRWACTVLSVLRLHPRSSKYGDFWFQNNQDGCWTTCQTGGLRAAAVKPVGDVMFTLCVLSDPLQEDAICPCRRPAAGYLTTSNEEGET